MNKEQFWEIIDNAREAANGAVNDCDRDGMYGHLVEALEGLEDSDLIKWQQIFSLYHGVSYKSKLWAAATVINRLCSDDGFEYFRAWLIARGKAVYLKALREPDDLADIEISGRARFEYLLYAANEAYSKKHSLESGDFRYSDVLKQFPPMTKEEEAEITSEIVYAPDMDIDLSNGNRLLSLLPKLCKKYKWRGIRIYIGNLNDREYNFKSNDDDYKDWTLDFQPLTFALVMSRPETISAPSPEAVLRARLRECVYRYNQVISDYPPCEPCKYAMIKVPDVSAMSQQEILNLIRRLHIAGTYLHMEMVSPGYMLKRRQAPDMEAYIAKETAMDEKLKQTVIGYLGDSFILEDCHRAESQYSSDGGKFKLEISEPFYTVYGYVGEIGAQRHVEVVVLESSLEAIKFSIRDYKGRRHDFIFDTPY